MRLRALAVILSFVTSVWTIGAGYYATRLFGTGLAMGSLGSVALILIGVFLLVDTAACLIGISKAFYIGAVLSALILLELVASYVLSGVPPSAGDPSGFVRTLGFDVSVPLAVITALVDGFAGRRRRRIAEENHPLNLPVFG